MSLLNDIIDSAGDMLGTSRLAKINRCVAKPLLKASITREEYNQSNKFNWFEIGDDSADAMKNFVKSQTDPIYGGDRYKQKQAGVDLLNTMSDHGTDFHPDRLLLFISNLQSGPGDNPIPYLTSKHMSYWQNFNLNQELDFRSVMHNRL